MSTDHPPSNGSDDDELAQRILRRDDAKPASLTAMSRVVDRQYQDILNVAQEIGAVRGEMRITRAEMKELREEMRAYRLALATRKDFWERHPKLTGLAAVALLTLAICGVLGSLAVIGAVGGG